MREHLHDHIPMHWHVRRTTTGSMTRELFQDWAVSARLVACLTRLPAFLDVATSFFLRFFVGTYYVLCSGRFYDNDSCV